MRRDLPPLPDEPDDRLPGGVGDASVALVDLADVAAEHHRLMRRALAMVVAAREAGAAGVSGLPVGSVLRLEHRLSAGLVAALDAVADRLDVMPAMARVFAVEVIEFDDLADVVRETSSLSGRLLAEVDEWAACRASDLASRGLLEQLRWDVQDRVVQLRAPGWANRQERRRERGDELRSQQDFDGGGHILASYGPVGYSKVMTSLETVAGPPAADGRTRPQQRADALVAVCEAAMSGDAADDVRTDSLDGDPGPGPVPCDTPRRGEVRLPRTPRPTISVVVDLASATTDRFAHLVRVTGLRAAPMLSARLVDTLAANAELLVQVADGRRPLLELRAEDIPEAVRRTVVARDRGCRAPGCSRPPRACDVHHMVWRTDGGVHDPDNLILLCRLHHRGVDRWAVTLVATTAEVRWRRHGTRHVHVTLPHGARPPPRRVADVPLAEWEAPPIPPPPDVAPPDDTSSGRSPGPVCPDGEPPP